MKKLGIGVVGAIAALLLIVVLLLQSVVGNAAKCITNIAVNGATSFLKSAAPAQLKNLALIDQIGRELNLGEKDRATAISVAIQESRARNLRYGDRDSKGLFQQRPSQGWGTVEQILDVNYSIRKFYQALTAVEGRDLLTPLQIALKVQRPSEAAYRSPDNYFPGWVDDALSFIRGAVSGPAESGPPTNNVATREQVTSTDLCSIDLNLGGIIKALPGFGPSGAGPGKLSWPTINVPINSGFGMRFHPIKRYWTLHNGVDMAAPCGSPVYATADGVVKTAGRQGGYGNFVQINHGGSIHTGSAHLRGFGPGITPGATVKQGQKIGEIGLTGSTNGCHLHFVVFWDGKPVDPKPYLGK